MKAVHRLLSLLGGWVTFQVLVPVTGILSAIAVSKDYFELFRPHLWLALLIQGTFVVALPMFLLCFGGIALTLHRFRSCLREAALWALAGFLLAWFGSTVLGWFALEQAMKQYNIPDGPSFGTYLSQLMWPGLSVQTPIWAAPWAGFAAGVLWVRRSQRA